MTACSATTTWRCRGRTALPNPANRRISRRLSTGDRPLVPQCGTSGLSPVFGFLGLDDLEGKADRVPLLALGLEGEGDEGLVGEPRRLDLEAPPLAFAREFQPGKLQRPAAAI